MVFSLHLTLPYLRTRGEFSPFALTPSGHIFDETHFYSPGPHRFERFGILSHDTDIFENRNLSGIYPQAPSVIFGSLAKIIGNFELSWLLFHGLLPALLWLMARILFQSSPLAWAFVLIGFGPKLALLLSPAAFSEPPDVTRLPSPALSGIALLGCMTVLVRCLSDGFTKLRTLMVISLSGTLFEFYPFYAMAWFSTLGLLLGFCQFQRKTEPAKSLLIILVGSLLLASPTLWRMLAYRSSLHESTLLRQGFTSHFPSYPGILLFFLSGLGALMALKKNRTLLGVALALLAGAGLCSNLQILTGVDIHYWLHYRMRLIQPVLVTLLCAALFTKFHRMAPVIVILALCLTVYRQIRLAGTLESQFRDRQKTVEMLRWLKTHLAAPSVIASSELEVIATLPAVSGHWSFVPSSYRTQATDNEILWRYVVASRIEGRSLSDALARFSSHPLVSGAPWTRPVYFFLRRPAFTEELRNTFKELWKKDLDLEEKKFDYLMVRKQNSELRALNWNLIHENAEWKLLAPKRNIDLSAK